jgi:hypothetical protein
MGSGAGGGGWRTRGASLAGPNTADPNTAPPTRSLPSFTRRTGAVGILGDTSWIWWTVE